MVLENNLDRNILKIIVLPKNHWHESSGFIQFGHPNPSVDSGVRSKLRESEIYSKKLQIFRT